MPAIKELKSILSVTPADQAILLEANHGVGKSEFIRDHFTELGYSVITLFLGQMADAGDLIGLPDRTELSRKVDGKIVTHKVTEFCPPKWWNFDSDAKVVIFMDEFNRGKPEVYQCVFDMVLNRRLNGYDLPKETRIVAAVNPVDSSFDYEVKELDSALLDRFNVYRFAPSIEDWIDWAMNHSVHKYVIGFINKNRQFLDPEMKADNNTVLPSRRSWKRVSDVINQYDKIANDEELFKNVFSGIVGIGATARFYEYVKNEANQLSALNIINAKAGKAGDDVFNRVKQMKNSDLIAMNKEIAMYLAEEFELLKESSDSARYVGNVGRYLKSIPNEIMAEFYGSHVSANNPWAVWVLTQDKKLAEDFIRTIQGKTKEEKKAEQKLKDNLSGDDSSDAELAGTAGDDGEEWKKNSDDEWNKNVSDEIDDLLK